MIFEMDDLAAFDRLRALLDERQIDGYRQVVHCAPGLLADDEREWLLAHDVRIEESGLVAPFKVYLTREGICA